MATIAFIYEGISTIIQCSKEQKMKYICNKFCNKINVNINNLLFLYGGTQLNMEKKFEEYSKENTIKILVYKNENEVCPTYGKLLDNEKVDNLILSIRLFNQINNEFILLLDDIKLSIFLLSNNFPHFGHISFSFL